jgi:hypothetical protein
VRHLLRPPDIDQVIARRSPGAERDAVRAFVREVRATVAGEMSFLAVNLDEVEGLTRARSA